MKKQMCLIFCDPSSRRTSSVLQQEISLLGVPQLFSINVVLSFRLVKMRIVNHIYIGHILLYNLKKKLEGSTVILHSQRIFWWRKNQQNPRMVQKVQIKRDKPPRCRSKGSTIKFRRPVLLTDVEKDESFTTRMWWNVDIRRETLKTMKLDSTNFLLLNKICWRNSAKWRTTFCKAAIVPKRIFYENKLLKWERPAGFRHYT